MSLCRIINCGSLLYNKFCHSLPCSSIFSGRNGNLGKFFSSFCDNKRSLESNKTVFNSFSPFLIHSRGLKHKGTLRLRCKDCYFVRKDGEMYVMCASYPRHKQKQKAGNPKYTWILTHACQSKVRPY